VLTARLGPEAALSRVRGDYALLQVPPDQAACPVVVWLSVDACTSVCECSEVCRHRSVSCPNVHPPGGVSDIIPSSPTGQPKIASPDGWPLDTALPGIPPPSPRSRLTPPPVRPCPGPRSRSLKNYHTNFHCFQINDYTPPSNRSCGAACSNSQSTRTDGLCARTFLKAEPPPPGRWEGWGVWESWFGNQLSTPSPVVRQLSLIGQHFFLA